MALLIEYLPREAMRDIISDFVRIIGLSQAPAEIIEFGYISEVNRDMTNLATGNIRIHDDHMRFLEMNVDTDRYEVLVKTAQVFYFTL
jgi:hypothetical protein